MMLEVTKIFREKAPESFNLEDNNGVNAIELAIEHDADLRVIKNMQRTAMNYERDMAKREKNTKMRKILFLFIGHECPQDKH